MLSLLCVPTAQRGERSARYLDAQRYAHAGISYHYADVIAELSATRFGERGVRVREQYQLAL